MIDFTSLMLSSRGSFVLGIRSVGHMSTCARDGRLHPQLVCVTLVFLGLAFFGDPRGEPVFPCGDSRGLPLDRPGLERLGDLARVTRST